MAINPIEAPIALDLTLRESPGGAIRSKRATVPAPAAAAQSSAEPAEPEPAQAPVLEQTLAQPSSMNLKFSTDEKTGKTVVALVDPSGKVLRQVPSDEALKVAEQIGRFQGLLVDLKV